MNNSKSIYVALVISILFHIILLSISNGKISKSPINEKINVTFKTQNILPRVNNLSKMTRLKKNKLKTQNKNTNNGNTSRYMEGNDKNILAMKYTDMIRQRIQEALIYPAIARKYSIQGKPYVIFSIDKYGNLISVHIYKSSGSKILDEAAINAVKNASPFPCIPDKLFKNQLTFIQGLSFALK